MVPKPVTKRKHTVVPPPPPLPEGSAATHRNRRFPKLRHTCARRKHSLRELRLWGRRRI
eukprot:SAG11_NODE_25380_length_359_cov_1.346154_1_plen_58_part_10